MWYDQNKAQSPWRIPEVMQLLTTVNIPLSRLWRKVWKCETRIVNVILVWAERQTKSPRTSQYNGNSSIHWSDTQQPPSCTLHMWQKAVIPEATSFLCLHPYFPCGKGPGSFFCCPCKVQGSFPLLDAAPLRGTEFSAAPSRKIWRQCHGFLKCRPVSSTIVQAGSITFPSFLPVYSFPCLENC